MPNPQRPMRLPSRALPTFGRGAFRGTVVPSSSMPSTRDEAHTSAPFRKISPTHGYRPVEVTAYSAGSRVRLGVVDVLREWWVFIGRMGGEVFRRQPVPQERAGVPRLMRPVGRFQRLPSNPKVVYEPLSYGRARAGKRSTGITPRGAVAQRDRIGGKPRGRRWER